MKQLHWTQYLVSLTKSACDFADVINESFSMEQLPRQQHRNSIFNSLSPIKNNDQKSSIFSLPNNQSNATSAWQRPTATISTTAATSEFSGCLQVIEFPIDHLPIQWCDPCTDKTPYVPTNSTAAVSSGCLTQATVDAGNQFSVPQFCLRFSDWSIVGCSQNLTSSKTAAATSSQLEFSNPDQPKSLLTSIFSHILQVVKIVFYEEESSSGLVVNSHLLADLDHHFRPEFSDQHARLAKTTSGQFSSRRFSPTKTQDNVVIDRISLCNNTTVNLVTSESFVSLYNFIFDANRISFVNMESNATSSTPFVNFTENSIDHFGNESMAAGSDDRLKILSLSFWFWLIVAVLMGVMSLLTTFGNMLVIISFIYDSKLRTVSNFYILNLAIADFLIGVFCIPLYMPSILWGEWRLGRTLCKMFLVVDNIVCSGSVLNIMLISSDRYLSVIHAMTYRVEQTPKKAVMKMLAVWVVAFTIYGPSTLFWEYFVGEKIVGPNECLPEFYRNFPYTFSVAVIEFITPLASVSFINLKIYLNIKSRSEKMKEKSAVQHGGVQGAAADILKERELRNLKRDKKAARALAVIVGAFSLSWAPYTVCNLIRTLWPSWVGPTVFETTFWLLWLNSTINPFLYPYCHPHFRQTFEELVVEKLGSLFCKKYAMRKQRQRLNPVVNTKPTPF